MSEYFNQDGNPLTVEQWGQKFENFEDRQIMVTKLDNGTVISTVWIGLGHGYGPTGPLIFETLLQEADNNEEERYHYSTKEEALNHHKHLAETYYDEQEPINRWQQVSEEI